MRFKKKIIYCYYYRFQGFDDGGLTFKKKRKFSLFRNIYNYCWEGAASPAIWIYRNLNEYSAKIQAYNDVEAVINNVNNILGMHI